MKEKQKRILTLGLILAQALNVSSQCGVSYSLSSATNMLGMMANSTNPVVANKDLNTVAFLHRHNVAVFGGNSGNLRYDVSANNGAAWTTDIGVLNPLSTNAARYPSAVMHNPSSNTSTNNAYIGYIAPTVDPSSTFYTGVVSGGRLLSGTNNTEIYNQPSSPSYLGARSAVKGAPGVFWAIDKTSPDGINFGGSIIVYKGVWSSTGNNINWALNSVLNPSLSNVYSAYPLNSDVNIAFDPSGNFGWIGFMGDLSSNSNGLCKPIFYKTVNGGLSWTGPLAVNLSTLNCLSGNITPGDFAAASAESNLVVDALGNPHFIGIFGSGNVSLYNPYVINAGFWHHILDITTTTGGAWIARDVSNLITSSAGYLSQGVVNYNNLQASRTDDGTRLFFSWTDNTSLSLGSQNLQPNFFSRGLNITTQLWTNTRDFTSCNVSTNGQIFFPHVAKEILQPLSGTYKLAPVYCQFTSPSNPSQTSNFWFLDNCLFSNSDFTVALSSLSVSIVQGSTALLCPGSIINLQINGTYNQILWSNGNQTNINPVNSPGQYVVTASSGCASNSDTIVVKTLTMSVNTNSSTICAGSYANMVALGNAYGYTWTPGGATGTNIAVNPSASTVFTISAGGDNGCVTTSTVGINVNPVPNLVGIGNKPKVCAGEEITIQATGALIYVWSTGATTSSMTAFPLSTTIYTLTGYNSFGCLSTFTISQLVEPCTGLDENHKQDSYTLFPNPNTGSFYIKAKENIHFDIYNELGQKVRTVILTAENSFKCSIDNLDTGIYFIHETSANNGLRHKVIVTH